MMDLFSSDTKSFSSHNRAILPCQPTHTLLGHYSHPREKGENTVNNMFCMFLQILVTLSLGAETKSKRIKSFTHHSPRHDVIMMHDSLFDIHVN